MPTEPSIAPADPERFADILDPPAMDRFRAGCSEAASSLRGRTVWHVNSTAQGGGVAELLRSVLPYLAGSGVAVRWGVIDADAAFFELTKRLHNLLHGQGDEGPLVGPDGRPPYERALEDNLPWFLERIR